MLRIGVDIGGTFTDFVVYRPETGALETFKLFSTPQDPAEAVLTGLKRILSQEQLPEQGIDIIHGSTVATNALLERKGARTALITTSGFSDMLQIGRQNRPQLYDLFVQPVPSLVPSELRFEVAERVDHTGSIIQSLQADQVEAVVDQLQREPVDSVAVCLLFSFLYPQHERAIKARLSSLGFHVSISSDILPEFREYERCSTTAVNAYVSPVLEHYLTHLESTQSRHSRLRVMQSNGGNLSLEEARQFGVRCILSGPAGGVIGARYLAHLAQGETGLPRVITFDMGGTSSDVSLIDGEAQVTTEAVIGGCPIHIPVLDVHTIGAGGGSLAEVDAGGALRVGPRSAGADPGPACYGKGSLPTVTDANLVLGRLDPQRFLGGCMPLDATRAWQALQHLGSAAGIDPVEAALGVIEVANAHMERALRVISVERGYDPADYSLLSFGGAGGLHAAELARRLGIARVIVPPLASTLSAFGMLAADVVKDFSLTVMLPGDAPLIEIAARLEELVQRGRQDLLADGIPAQDIRLEPSLDMRYRGQSYELSVPFDNDPSAAFHELHQKTYGYSRPEAPLEIVNLRLKAIGQGSPPHLPRLSPAPADPSPAWLAQRQVYFAGGWQDTAVYAGEALLPGNAIQGPALVVRSDTTILLAAQDTAQVDSFGNLNIAVGSSGRQ